MRTIEQTVYNFNELPDEAKEKAIQKWYESEDYPFLHDDILEQLNQIDPYFSDVKLQYSLSYCQSDGLSFSASEFDLKKWLDDKTELKQSVKNALCEFVYGICSIGNAGCYSYASKNQIEFEYNYDKSLPLLKSLFGSILEDIKEYYMQTCKKLEKFGYSILEYRMNFEEFNEHCQANGYEFDEEGNLI